MNGKSANSDDHLLVRTRKFALRVIKLVDTLPHRRTADVMGTQLLRCATSVGANYRAARRARSTAEFCAKLGIVEEEADESTYWLDLIAEAGLVKATRLTDLQNEASEIVAMIVSSIRTARNRRNSTDGRRKR